MRFVPCAVASVLVGLTLAGAAAAAGELPLPSPTLMLTSSPPLLGGPIPRVEGVRHTVRATERVRVRLDEHGRPFAVSVVQRLEVGVLGDYVFVIPVPARRATAATGSQSAPGLRTNQLLWNGFDPGRKVLAALLELDAGRAAPSLPLRVRIVRSARSTRVLLANATSAKAASLDENAQAPGLARYLDAVRDAAARGALPAPGSARTTADGKPVSLSVLAPLRVRGTVRAGVATRRVDVVLGDGDPSSLSLSLPAGAAPRVSLSVEPVPPTRLLTPPAGAARWREARRPSGRALLRRAAAALLALARTRQYDQCVGNPDPVGRSETRYVFVTGKRAATPRAATRPGDGSRPWWRKAAVFTLGIAALGCGAVVWSRA